MNNIKNDINLREAVRRREHLLPPMPANLNEKVMSSLTPKSLPLTPSEGRGTQSRFSSLSLWRGAGVRLAGLIAASIVLLLVLHYNNKVEPEQQPVVAEVVQPESPRPVPEPAPEPVVEEKQEPQATQPAAQPVRPKMRVKVQEPAEEPLLAEEEPVEEAPVEEEHPGYSEMEDPFLAIAQQMQDIRSRGEQVRQEVAQIIDN